MDKNSIVEGFRTGRLKAENRRLNQRKVSGPGRLWNLWGFSALVIFVGVILLFVVISFASINNQIPDQILSVNSSSELDLSAYFPEFQDNVWFSASGTENLSVVFGKSLAEPWRFYRSPSVLIVPSKGWTGEESIEFKATNGTDAIKKSVIVRVV